MNHSYRRAPALLLVALLMATLPLFSAADGSPERIKFKRGRTTAVVKGKVKSSDPQRYVLGARAGQQMSVHVASKGTSVLFSLLDANGDLVTETDSDDWSGELPIDGDYTIVLFTEQTRAQKYTLEVTIR